MKLKDWKKEDLVRLYEELGSLKAVARHYGVTRERIRQVFNMLGLKIPTNGKRGFWKSPAPTGEQRRFVIELKRQGYSQREISEKLNLTLYKVCRILREDSE